MATKMVATWRVASGLATKYQLLKVHACAESKKILRYFSGIKVTKHSTLFPCTFTTGTSFSFVSQFFVRLFVLLKHYLIGFILAGNAFGIVGLYKWKELHKIFGSTL